MNMRSDRSARVMQRQAPETHADPDLTALRQLRETRCAGTFETPTSPPVRPNFARSENRIYSPVFLEYLQFEDAPQADPIQKSNCSSRNLPSPVTHRTVCEFAGRINLAGARKPCRVAMAFQTPFHV